jgi:hypothetical protein
VKLAAIIATAQLGEIRVADDGDIAEVRHSLTHAMALSADEQAQVSDRVQIVTDRVHRGLSFYAELKRQLDVHRPDLVWINPLLAFIGSVDRLRGHARVEPPFQRV